MIESKNKNVYVENWGKQRYIHAWNKQEKLLESIIRIKKQNRSTKKRIETPNYLIFLEHHPVYTLGKSGDIHNLLIDKSILSEKDVDFVKSNRGGDITFHGPGQLVIYPILDLDYFFTDIHKYLRFLEESVILTLKEYGVFGQRVEGLTGVWVDAESENPRKICAIGIKCSRWVTMHGIGFNINSNLDYFKYIVPCGIEDKSVTSLQKETQQLIDMEVLKSKFLRNFTSLFNIQIV